MADHRTEREVGLCKNGNGCKYELMKRMRTPPPPSLPNHEENESVNESRTLKPQVPTFSWKRMSDENELVQNTWWPSNLLTSQQHILTILPHYIRQTPWQCFASTPFLPQLQGLNYSICWCSCHTASDRPLGSASAPFLPQLQRP